MVAKAIVLFSDGMDWYSDKATFEGTVRYLDEEGVVVYPIRYDTRATTEKLAREQSGQATPTLPTISVDQTTATERHDCADFPGRRWSADLRHPTQDWSIGTAVAG